MKISCLQKNLSIGLNTVERAITRNNTLPILNNILLQTEQGRLKILATNLELGIITKIGGKIHKQGQITVPSKIITSLVSGLPNDKIELEVRGSTLYISSREIKSKIKGLPASDFPIIPTVSEKHKLELSAPVVKRALSQVTGSAASSESRPELSGVFWKISEQDLKIVATDSYRLAEKRVFLREKQANLSFILPFKTSNELIRLLAEKEGTVKVTADDTQIEFDFFNTKTISRLLEGVFPDYERIIPSSFKTEAVANTSFFANNLRLASLFSGRVDDVSLEFSSPKKGVNFLEIKSASAEIGSQESSIPIKIKKGGAGKVVLNYRYLIEGLNNILTDEVRISLSSSDSPFMLSPYSEAKRPKDKDFLYLVMPIKN